MNRWTDLIKLPLYRVFMPVAVGVVFVFLVVIGKISVFSDIISIKIFLECFKQTKIQVMEIGEDIKIVLPNFVLIVAILAIFFVIGEVCSMIGEIIVNLFFCYCPIAPFKGRNEGSRNSNLGSSNSGRDSSRNVGNEDDYLMEKVFPCSEKWIKYQDFVRVLEREGVAEVSEVHFVLSRFFAGLMIVSLATVNILVAIITTFFVIIAVCFCLKIWQSCWKKLCQKIDEWDAKVWGLIVCVLGCGLVICVLLILGLYICWVIGKYLNHDSFLNYDSFTLFFYDSLISFLFTFFFFFASLYYRAHANLLIYHQRSGDNI